MTVPYTTFDIPADQKIVMPDGSMNQAWIEFFDRFGKAMTIIRNAADTAADFTEFQSDLQEIS